MHRYCCMQVLIQQNMWHLFYFIYKGHEEKCFSNGMNTSSIPCRYIHTVHFVMYIVYESSDFETNPCNLNWVWRLSESYRHFDTISSFSSKAVSFLVNVKKFVTLFGEIYILRTDYFSEKTSDSIIITKLQ